MRTAVVGRRRLSHGLKYYPILKGISSIISPHCLWRSLGPFSPSMYTKDDIKLQYLGLLQRVLFSGVCLLQRVRKCQQLLAKLLSWTHRIWFVWLMVLHVNVCTHGRARACSRDSKRKRPACPLVVRITEAMLNNWFFSVPYYIMTHAEDELPVNIQRL